MYIRPMTQNEEQDRIAYTAVEASMAWSGWGSPVGLSILLVAIGIFLVCLHMAGILH
jgi:hypothetical protein